MNFLSEPFSGSSLKTLHFVNPTAVNSICWLSPQNVCFHASHPDLHWFITCTFLQSLFQNPLSLESLLAQYIWFQSLLIPLAKIWVRDGQVLLSLHPPLLPFQLQAHGNIATDISYPFLLVDEVIWLSLC